MFLVDTNVVSEMSRRQADPRVMDWLSHQYTISVSAITIEELEFGLGTAPTPSLPRLRAWLDAIIERLEIVPVDRAVAVTAGTLRAGRRRAGRPASQSDMLIAATALVHGRALATRNTRDFEACGIGLVNPFE